MTYQKADININKRPRDNNNEIIFLNDMFIDNVVLTGISTKARNKDDIGYYNIIIRNHLKKSITIKNEGNVCIRK